MATVFFAGGGTGGHLMPALAIAQAMVDLDPTTRPFFIGGERGIEARVLPLRPWPFALLPLEPIYRREWWKNVRLPMALYRSLRGVRAALAAEEPALVIGTGGYVAGPVVWAAANRGIPAVLQEQNAYPGFATRRLAARVQQIHLGFPEARQHLGKLADGVVSDSGNPIVPPPAVRPDRRRAKRLFGFAPDAPMVLIFGGSQGARAINEVVAAALAEDWPKEVSLLWQTGAASFGSLRHLEVPGRVRLTGFLDPMADAYAAADLVVARAGAMSIAELCAWGLPSVLVPLPTAAADHQRNNAVALSSAGAALLLEQRNFTPQSLMTTARSLLGDTAKMADMSRAALSRARPEAASNIAAAALRLLPNP